MMYKLKKKLRRGLPLRKLHRRGLLLKPYDVAFSLTGKCNQKCRMCDIGFHDKQHSEVLDSNRMVENDRVLSLKENKKIIDKISGFNPIVRLIGAGEPLVYGEIIPFLRYLKKKNLPTVIVTNGMNLKKHAQELFDLQVYSVNISIDGPKTVHDYIRGVEGSFEKAMEGLRELSKLRKKHSSLFPQIRINCTISDHNFRYIDKFVDMMIKEDIDILNFFHLYYKPLNIVEKHNAVTEKKYNTTPSSIYGVNPFNVEADTLAKRIKYIKTKYKNYNITFQPDLQDYGELYTYYKQPETFINKNICQIPWTKMYLLPNGDVIPMYMCINLRLGNVLDSGVLKCWNGRGFNKMRNELQKRKNFKICSRCCGMFAE